MKVKWRAKKEGAEGPGGAVAWQQEPNFQSNHVPTKDQNGCVKCGDAVVGAKYLPLHCLTKWEKRFVGFSIFRPV